MNRQKELDEYHTNDEYHEWIHHGFIFGKKHRIGSLSES
jgi:hypothetical protein